MKTPRYYCFRNLHKNCFSTVFRGKTVAYPDAFVIHNVELKVSEKGRQRVLRERCKNVHARVSGTQIEYLNPDEIDESTMIELYYDPYRFSTFIVRETGQAVFELAVLYGKDNRIFTPSLDLGLSLEPVK